MRLAATSFGSAHAEVSREGERRYRIDAHDGGCEIAHALADFDGRVDLVSLGFEGAFESEESEHATRAARSAAIEQARAADPVFAAMLAEAGTP